ncbi:bifunctional glycosyltransferase/CDP-glycerol:glycerophosphate glycerophosphotransferase [Streptomyces bauhiniae]|uniref:Bifunctional glycosyltransferase family 2 protein/CDP-glycerol:glycerophosphate glycerophosphotransferase n=1 Tax=Streptomyces bauhiniae TaxID=2340725 RepID=A0A7K3R297_9ACTN|nr:bifunctional glycosyltransferase family 2 protein/CDP-glycerol:glycerophosphate glycerophosphotransferase [Streptomyces bauhiniae]NEB96283.1 bifunctional glycosyltransferase family 2 protein/CDP-glycerol:glycerophosphate glycerophosphotransferase [Streptomyces bauhiniae]
MPRFSVIVPAYQVQAYLAECLDSVLAQSYPDFELIAVDDRSPDGCGAIIDEYAARDPRVRAVHLAENAGLGPARNAGIDQADGDYLLFLDGDDTLTPHTLRAVADRLAATGEPDVLVFDYARTHWDGTTLRNRLADRLTEDGPAPFTLADRPGLLRVLMVAWNKAYRREFVAREGFRFPPGYYEDTPWTFPVLMAAGSLATLDRVCVHYRQRRRGSILRTTSPRHFDVFDQYDRVFAYVAARPELERWRPELFARMLDHLTTIATRRDRLPRGSHPAFLRRARAHCRRHRAPGTPVPPGLRRALVRHGLHRTFRTLRLAAALRRRARVTAGRGNRKLGAALLRLHYRVQRHLPLRADRALFAATPAPDHGCDPSALEAAFHAHAPHIRTAWLGRPGTAAHFTALARSKYLVHNAGFGPGLDKRPGQVYVQTGQGTPLGHTGLDLLEHPAAALGTDFAGQLREVDQWDYLLSGNRHSTLVRERAHPGGYTTLEYGSPRNDAFQHATSADVARLRASLGVPEGAVAVLYVPARREHRRTQTPPLDPGRLLGLLGPRFTLLTRAPLGEPVKGARLVDVSGHPDLPSLCLASDALLTDFSPLMFDYAGLDRPVVLHTGDWDTFRTVRGTYLDLLACPPGPLARTEAEVADVFASGHWRGVRSARLRAAFRDRFCPYDDGDAGERVVRHVVLGQPAVPPAARGPVRPAAGDQVRAPLASVPQPSGPLPVTEGR